MPVEPILTIGMAVYDDYSGLRSTIQSIRINNADVMDRVRWVIVDNHPGGKHNLAGIKLAQKIPNCRYFGLGDRHGTCPPRQRVFEVASTPWVMCMDSHVQLFPRAIPALLEYIDANPDSNDLLSGPLVLDNLKDKHTHLNNVWRSQWQGTWGNDKRAEGVEPFEIEAQGLWLFAARKEAWLNVGGFNPKFRGFGGGEFYIHEKFRRAGGKCLCLPELKGIHQFDFPDGRKYPNNLYERARNKVIGHTELGWPIDLIREQFVGSGKLSETEWKLLTANPSNPPERSPTLGLILPRKGSGERPTVIAGRQPPIGGKMGRKAGPTDGGDAKPAASKMGMLWNATKALTRFVFDGLKTVTKDQYAARLAICEACPNRIGNKCNLCGCNLSLKAQGRLEKCPENRWSTDSPPSPGPDLHPTVSYS